MEPVYTRAQLEALQVPVLETMTMFVAGQIYPLARLDASQRQVSHLLALAYCNGGTLPFATQWITNAARASGARCWLVVEIAQPLVVFALAFTLPTALPVLVDLVISRTLTLLADDHPEQMAQPLDEDRLLSMVASSLTLSLDAGDCDRLAQYLLRWSIGTAEGAVRRWATN